MSSISLPISERTSSSAISFYAGVFCVTAATLMLQIIETRILSVQAWYHLAFFVISSAMFGLTLGAVWVYLRGERFTTRTLSFDLAYFSNAFALSTVVCLLVQMSLHLFVAPVLGAFVTWLEMALCLAVPFFFSGVVISLALTRSPYPIGRVYGVDLAGGAVGCLGVLALLNMTDGPSAILWVAALAALSADLFLLSDIGSRPAEEPRFKLIPKYRGSLCLILMAWAFLNGQDASTATIRPIFVKDRMEVLDETPAFIQWNSFSRVSLRNIERTAPAMWGPSPFFVPAGWPVEQRRLRVDGDAGTSAYGIRGDLSKAGFLKYDITTLAYRLPGLERAAVIGVGGGRDLISARLFGVPEVLGLEINPIFVSLLRDDPEISSFVGLDRIGGIDLVVDEARNWFARSRDQFDLIQMSLIDTWAATGAGAFTLSENGLYTVEAWRTFLRRLTPKGAFTVSRWYASGHVRETGRMVSLAVAALLAEGVSDPSQNIYLAAGSRIATLVVSREALTPDALAKLTDATLELGFEVLITPDSKPTSPILAEIVASRDRETLIKATSDHVLDLTPPTDDKPFFFNQLKFNFEVIALMATGALGYGVSSGNLLATGTLILLFLVSLALVVATILVPLADKTRAVDRSLVRWGTLYFLMIGAGFMLIEIALLQRFSVFLGHPVYSLGIVLFSIILATGIGCMVSDLYVLRTRRRFLAWSLLLVGYALALALFLPPILIAYESAPLLGRGLICVALIAPLGFLMGFGFPTGMRMIAGREPATTPWFWGINGASGVMASVLAVACSIAFGITVTLVLGALCYLMLIPAGLKIGVEESPAANPAGPREAALPLTPGPGVTPPA